jgi:hypothetical protein
VRVGEFGDFPTKPALIVADRDAPEPRLLSATILGGSDLGYWILNNRPIPEECVRANGPVWIGSPTIDEIKSRFLAEHAEVVVRSDELLVGFRGYLVRSPTRRN